MRNINIFLSKILIKKFKYCDNDNQLLDLQMKLVKFLHFYVIWQCRIVLINYPVLKVITLA